MKIAFFGSPIIAATLLEHLIEPKYSYLDIAYVFTQPDKPVGKRLVVTPTPVKKVALKHKISVFDKELRKNEKEAAALLRLHNISLCIVYAYGELISENMLSVPSYGYWNVHPSNLPKYRGPTPVAYTLMLGEKTTAISIIKLVKKMDAGPLINQMEVDVSEDELRDTLEMRLTHLTPELINETLHKLQNQNLKSVNQKEEDATYTSLFNKEHGFIDIGLLHKAINKKTVSKSELPVLLQEYISKYNPKNFHSKSTGQILFDYYRALSPWPGLWTKINTDKGEKRMKLSSLSLKDGALIVSKVQLEGKETDFKTFDKSYNIFGKI